MKHPLSTFLELLRWIGAGIGIFLAFQIQNDPKRQLDILSLWLVLSIAGLTGFQSLFFGKAGAEQLGYEKGSAYQRQSGLLLLSLTGVTTLVYCLGWSLEAKAALLMVLLMFLALSGVNHAYSAIKERNTHILNAMRPIMTIILLWVVIPFIIRAFS